MRNGLTRYSALMLFVLPLVFSPAAQAAPPARVNAITDTVVTSAGELRVTPLYHGSVMLQFAGKVIHIDPWSEADYSGLPSGDLIVSTHTHADHLDRVMIERLKKDGTIIVGPDAVIDTLNCAPGCGQVETVNNGERKTVLGIGFEGVAMYNITHGSRPGMPFHHKGVGSGYVMTFGDKRLYVSGDSDCTPQMRALRHIDIAFLNMSPPRTMSTVEAAACARAFRPKVVYPLHYRRSNPADFAEALKNEPGIEVRIRKLEGEP